MADKTNPFKPDGIVAPGMFAGRLDEITAIERSLAQTKNGNPHHFLIQGERGIGKSSLFLYVQLIASGTIPLDNKTMRFLTI
ncbi:MAG: ATP-binding protein, partial [Candidatus Acidiferrales bacterium]